MIEIDYCMSLSELQELTVEEIYRIQKCAERDKDEIFRAECIYWMCRMEIDRRNNDKWSACLDVRCISNIFDEDYNIVFRHGNHYVLYEIEHAVLVYCEKWIPYIFTIIEDDSRCTWKYFGLWKDR